jgi:hypothetical protein
VRSPGCTMCSRRSRRRRAPKSIKVDTLNGAAIAALEAVGLKTKQLPDGKTRGDHGERAVAGVDRRGVEGAARLEREDGADVHDAHGSARSTRSSPSRRSTGRSTTSWAAPTATSSTASAPTPTAVRTTRRRSPGRRCGCGLSRRHGGEAYIPLSTRSRPQSLEILEEVADRFGYGLEKFAKGGSSRSRRRRPGKAARGDLTISNFGQRAGYKNTEFVNAIGKPDSCRVAGVGAELVAFHDHEVDAWAYGVEAADAAQRRRPRHDQVREESQLGVNKSLEKAKDKLDGLKDSASQLSGSVKSGNHLQRERHEGRRRPGPGHQCRALMGGLMRVQRDKAKQLSRNAHSSP